MADRRFSEEGLTTTRNRDQLANRISKSLQGIQNALSQETSDRTLEEQYEPLISDLQYLTIQAFEEGDQNWVNDCTAAIEFIVRQFATNPKPLRKLLVDTVTDAWERLKEDRIIEQEAKGDVAVRQESILSKIGRALFGKRK